MKFDRFALERLLPALALAGATLFWSGNFIAGRWLRGAVDPLGLNILRWSLCLILLLPVAGGRLWAERHALLRGWRQVLLLGATGIATFHVLVYAALARTEAINAFLILALAPVAVMAGSAVITGFRPRRAQVAGSIVALAGMMVLLTRGDPAALARLHVNAGDLIMLAAICVWAVYTLGLRHRPPGVSPAPLLAATALVALALMAPATLIAPPHLEPTPAVALAIGYVGIFASLAGFLLWAWGVAQIGPERAGQFVHLMPVFGPILAIGLLGETVSWPQAAGAALVLAGLILVVRTPKGATS